MHGSPSRSSEAKCGNKYGIGATSVGLLPLLEPPHSTPCSEELTWGGGIQGGLPGGGDTLWLIEDEVAREERGPRAGAMQ